MLWEIFRKLTSLIVTLRLLPTISFTLPLLRGYWILVGLIDNYFYMLLTGYICDELHILNSECFFMALDTIQQYQVTFNFLKNKDLKIIVIEYHF